MAKADQIVDILLEMGEFYDYFQNSFAINRRIRTVLKQVVGEKGITVQEFECLYALIGGTVLQRKLVSLFHGYSNHAQVSRMLASLTERGLILGEQVPGSRDSKLRQYALTAEGRHLVTDLEQKVEAISKSSLGAEDLEAGGPVQKRIRQRFEEPWNRL